MSIEGVHRKGLKLDPHDIELLRKDPANLEAFARIHMALRNWVRGRGMGLSRQDCEDIVSQAVYENMDVLRCDVIPAEEVPEIFRKSLNRLRSRTHRQFSRIVEYQAYDEFAKAFEEFNELDPEGKIDAERTREEKERRLLAVLFLLRKHLRNAVKMLSPRDYAIVCAEYKFHQFKGFEEPVVSLQDLPAATYKVAKFRARGRFLKNFEKLLLAETGEDRVAVEDALRLIRSKDFAEALDTLNGNHE